MFFLNIFKKKTILIFCHENFIKNKLLSLPIPYTTVPFNVSIINAMSKGRNKSGRIIIRIKRAHRQKLYLITQKFSVGSDEHIGIIKIDRSPRYVHYERFMSDRRV